MKKTALTLAGLAAISFSSATFASSFECWRYKNGKPQGYVNVKADSKSEAVSKATQKFRDMSKSMYYVKCHYN